MRRDPTLNDGRHETGPTTSDQHRGVNGKHGLRGGAAEDDPQYREQFFSE
ncbi:hypothetical protein GCM10009804_11380 [Kribbella hippodromi]|uniref:Uncharacterized protein n=1 Tax=Kribbella hippodromi TaxID=434347 RepID=A0ABP4N851_9ACTN